ncbi:MAG: hypothetical protein WA871_12335 [Candidatus Acidiferrales bacterium]
MQHISLQVIQRIAGYPLRRLYNREVIRTQLENVRDIMLSAAECDAWLTLTEISRMTRYGEASISAQLRHLRKPVFGGFRVEKRRREGEEIDMRSKPSAPGKWEYRIVSVM